MGEVIGLLSIHSKKITQVTEQQQHSDRDIISKKHVGMFVCWLLNVPATSYSVYQGRICEDNCTCCHTEIDVADQTFYLTQSQYTDTGPTSPSSEPFSPGACQGSHWRANFEVTGMTRPRKNPGANEIRTRDLRLSRRTPYH